MDGPDTPRRDLVKPPLASRRASLERGPRAQDQPPTDSVVIPLDEDEVRNGLTLFGAEEGRIVEEHETFESVPAHVGTIRPANRTVTPPVPPVATPAVPPVLMEARSSMAREASLLAAGLAVALVVFGFMAVRLMRTPEDGRLTTLNHRTAPQVDAARDLPGTSVDPPPATQAPTPAPPAPTPAPPAPLRPAEPNDNVSVSNDTSASDKQREAVVRPETASVRPPARSAPPVASPRETPRVRPEPPVQTASIPSPGPAGLLPGLESAIATSPGSPALPAIVVEEPRPVDAVPASLPRAEASAAPAPRLPAPETAIQTVLSQYRTAYRELDAGAARAIWPSVDTRALRKAFDGLEQQDVIFESCQIAIKDRRAVASCSGYAWYVPRVGSKDPHDDQRQWEFRFRKVDDAWLIDSVSAR